MRSSIRGFGLWAWIFGFLALFGTASTAVGAPPSTPASPSEHVSDEAKALSPSVRASLSRRLADYQAKGGHQIVVWIGQSTGDTPIEDFAVAAFERWRIGDPKLDDGLGVFVAVDDRAIRVEVGYGLEPTLTDLAASQVIRSIMIPHIREGDWDGAIVLGVEALVDTIEGAPGSLPADASGPSDEAPAGGLGWVEIVIGGVVAIAFIVLLITHPGIALGMLFMLGRGGGGGGGFGGGGGGFSGLGGRSGGGGATGHW
ncbi:TPM domain-containing protein [Nannocystaceae bacterium ST9]